MRDLQHPDVDDLDVTHVMHALSDPARLAIVVALADHREMHCAEISEHIGGDLGKSTMSHHYGILREAGLTRSRHEGSRKYLSLREEDMDSRFPGLLAAVLRSSSVVTPAP